MDLNSAEVTALVSSIRDSFRVRENHDPVYVDIAGNLVRLASSQHQVIFGRRGSGKSCLLVHFMRQSERDREVDCIYVNIDEIKRLPYPDILIRILLTIVEKLPPKRNFLTKMIEFRSPRAAAVKELRKLLDAPETSDVEETNSTQRKDGGKLRVRHSIASAEIGSDREQTTGTRRRFRDDKLQQLERHLQDFKALITSALPNRDNRLAILVDDLYLIQRGIQPDVVDYLHRLFRGTNGYLKIATIRHRTALLRHEGQTIGIEPGQDLEEISLDKTFEDFDATYNYLKSMLDQLGGAASIDNASEILFNAAGVRALTLASGGVPRDFLNTFVEAVDLSLQHGKKDRLTPSMIYKAAATLSYKSKIKNMKEDVGRDADALSTLFVDLINFALREKRKTIFLISHDDAQRYPKEFELLQQLMDFKLIHLVDANTSAASGRPGRYSAYTLDYSIFMEPRRRGIDVVEFWHKDDQRRPLGVRESPDYSLQRAQDVIQGERATESDIDRAVESIEVDDEPISEGKGA